MNEKTYVTQPFLPPMEEFTQYLQNIWSSKWLTNNGAYHQELEEKLCNYLDVKYISLFTNGTLALITALQALNIEGEVITTPYSFVATTHSLWWNKIRPIFIDIESNSCNLDPYRIERAITPGTSAILPVHVYGYPCNIERINEIAGKHKLKVIYDAAHAFGVKKNGESILNFGDLSVLSFHATKVFNTFEGGAIVCHSSEMKQRIDDLKNFGFRDEVTVVAPGINAKMSEVQAAMGLLQLKYVDSAIETRRQIDETYRTRLNQIKGIALQIPESSIKYNFGYFPIFIDEDIYGCSRDLLFQELLNHKIYGRRYFYPLISQFSPYRDLESAQRGKLKEAEKRSNQVICLPIYPDLKIEKVHHICDIIEDFTKHTK